MRDMESAQLRSLGTTWRQEAERRRRVTANDQAADALEYAASELDEQIRQLVSRTGDRTTKEVAGEYGVTEQTVRGWCRNGQIEATLTPHGWRVPVGAKPPTGRASAA